MPNALRSAKRFSALLGGTLAAVLLAAPANATYDWGPLNTKLKNQATTTGGVASGALVIYHKGQLVYAARNFGGWDKTYARPADNPLNQPHLVKSVSKVVSSSIILAALEDSSLKEAGSSTDVSINSLITKIYPPAAAANPQYGETQAAVNIGHLLSMTGGVLFLTEDPTKPSVCINRTDTTTDDCAMAVIAKPLNFWPGDGFQYSAGPWQILSAAILNRYQASNSSRANANWVGVAAHYLFTPCNFASMNYGQTVNPDLAGGMSMKIDDGGRLAEMLRTGKCGGVQVLTSGTGSSLSLQRTNVTNGTQTPTYLPDGTHSTNGNRWPAPDNRNYGYGIWRNDYSGSFGVSPNTTVFMGIGGWGAIAWIDVRNQTSGFLMVEDSANSDASYRSVALMNAILPIIETQAKAN